jgi:hypothetical protein
MINPSYPSGCNPFMTCTRFSTAFALLLVLLPALGSAQNYSIDFYTIDGGGEILAESADQRWQLSGTLGQWDSTPPRALSGSRYTLTGGFWSVNTELIDQLFQDRFQVLNVTGPNIAESSLNQKPNQR